MRTSDAVAILADGGADRAQIDAARQTLTAAGAKVLLIPEELAPERAHPSSLAALVILGGWSADQGASDSGKAIQLVREFVLANKPLAAIGDGVRLLIDADVVAGRQLASRPELADAIRKAGGEWIDTAVEVDEGLITGRSVRELPLFVNRLVRKFSARIDDRQVDLASEQSFPASDPPPGPSSIGAPEHAADAERQADGESRR